MAQRAQDLPLVIQDGLRPGKDQQAERPTMPHDSGCFIESLDQPSPDWGQASKGETENRATEEGTELPSTSGSGQDVPTEQPGEDGDNSRSFPVIGPRILDNEHVATGPDPGKTTSTHDGEVALEAGLTKPQQESQPPMSCLSATHAISSNIEADLTSLNSRYFALLSILHSLEKRVCQARNDLVHQATAEVNPTALHEMLLDTRLEISQAGENLLMATEAAHSSNTPVNLTNNVRKGAPCSKNPAEAHTNLTVSSSSCQNVPLGGEVSLEDPGQSQQCPANVQQRVETTDELQEEVPPRNEGPSNSSPEAESQLEDGERQDLPSDNQGKKQQPEDLTWVGATPNSTEDSVDNDLFCDNLLKTNMAKEEDTATTTSSGLGEKESSEKTDENGIVPNQVKGGQQEDQNKMEGALSSHESEKPVEKQLLPDLLEGHQQNVPKETGVTTSTPVTSGHLEEPEENGIQGHSEENGELEDGVTHTKLESGYSEEPQKSGDLPNNPVNEDCQDKDKDNTHMKMGQSEEPKCGILPIETGEENTHTYNGVDKRWQSEKPKNPTDEDPPENKDKTGVLSTCNNQEKRGQSEIPKNLQNTAAKEDPTEDKDEAGFLSNTQVKTRQSEEPKRRTDKSKDPQKENHEKSGVPSDTQVKRRLSEEPTKNMVLPLNNPANEDNKDKIGVPSTPHSLDKREQSEKPKNPATKDPPKGKDTSDVLSNTEVKRRKSEEPAKNVVLPSNNPANEDSQDNKDKTRVSSSCTSLKKTGQSENLKNAVKEDAPENKKKARLPSNSQEKRGRAEHTLKKRTLAKKSVRNEKTEDLGQKDQDKRFTPKQQRSRQRLAQGDATTEKETFVKAEIPAEKQSQVVNDRKQENNAGSKREDGKTSTSLKDEIRLNDDDKKYDLIVQIPDNASSQDSDQTLLEDTKTLKMVRIKNWMNLKMLSLLSFLSLWLSFLTAWSHKEKPPDVTSYRKITDDTTRVPVDHDALIYNVQRRDEENMLGDSSDEDGEEDQDGHNLPEWLAQDDIEDDLYLGSEDTVASPEAATAGPLFCSEAPENGQIAVGGGGNICLLNNQDLGHIGDHPSQHLPTPATQGSPNALGISLEEAVQHYRRIERGMTVTVLGPGEQVVSDKRIRNPTTLQEHILEHTADMAFETYPMDGFTVKLPGGHVIPWDMPLDPWTTRNITLQLHQANSGDITWQWRVTHSENPCGGRYAIEVNVHSAVGRGEARAADDRQPTERVENDRGVDCCICQDTEPDSRMVETTCGHNFHLECLLKWIQEEDACPLCWRREPLRQ